MINKKIGVFVLSLVMFSMCFSLVAAVEENSGANPVTYGVFDNIAIAVDEAYVKLIQPAAGWLIGDTSEFQAANSTTATTASEMLLAKFLLAIIIFSVIWLIVGKISFFSDQMWSKIAIAIPVSLLSIRWLSGEVITSIILPYSALGVALSAGLPFIIYFLAVKDFPQTARKISWIFFACIFVGLWIMRKTGQDAPGVGNFAWIYLATAVIAVIVLLADKTIQRAMKKSAAEATKGVAEARRRSEVMKDRADLEEKQRKNHITDPDYKKQDAALKKLEKKYDII